MSLTRHARTMTKGRSVAVRITFGSIFAVSATALSTVPIASIAPGTPSQVAALVAAAPSITSIPSNVTPSLANASGDTPTKHSPALATCQGLVTTKSPCLYGDVKGSKTVVLWGDSHAYMWFPAVNAMAKRRSWKLLVLFEYGCPVAHVSVWNSLTNEPYTKCDVFRTEATSIINRLKPALLIMTEEFQTKDSRQQQIKTARWTSALKQTLSSIGSGIKKAVLSDTIKLSPSLGSSPSDCLAANPTNVQACSTGAKSATYAAQRKSELTAATAEHTTYVNVIPWACSAVCTAIIGTMIVYYAEGHFTATYDSYLSDVLYQKLRPLL